MTKIYTLGEDSMGWRNKFEILMSMKTDESIVYIHPPKYELSATEYFQWFIKKISNCDVVILNLNDLDDKSKYDIAVINTINAISNKHIFVVGYGEQNCNQSNTSLPQFIKDALFHVSTTINDAVDYIVTNLIS